MKILNVVLSSLLHPHGITTWFKNYLKGLIDNRNENKIVFLTLTSISQKLDWYTEKHENFTHYCVKYNWENLHKVFTTEDFDIIHFHTSIFPSEKRPKTTLLNSFILTKSCLVTQTKSAMPLSG